MCMCVLTLDFAEEVLNKCVVSDPNDNMDGSKYGVLFNYEFIEDFRDANDSNVTENTDDTDSADG